MPISACVKPEQSGDPSARKSSKAIEPVVSTLAFALDGNAQRRPRWCYATSTATGGVELTANAELGATMASLISTRRAGWRVRLDEALAEPALSRNYSAVEPRLM
jgi:hypothetical protein